MTVHDHITDWQHLPSSFLALIRHIGRKKKKQEEPKSYLRCPYCGHAPIIVTGKCTYHNPRHTVYRYECELKCLQGEVCQTAEAAFDSWVRIVARYYDAENAIRQFRKERKS